MPNTYESIGTFTFSGSQATVTFTSIPETYTDLVLVVSALSSAPVYVRPNNDSTAAYSLTRLGGNGTSAYTGRFVRGAGAPNDRRLELGAGVSAEIAVNIFHFMNYSDTTTLKTVLCRANAVSSEVKLSAGLYNSTAAIFSIEVGNTNSANFNAGGTASLYGIKAA